MKRISIIIYFLILFLNFILSPKLFAEGFDTPLEKNNFTKISTHQELLDYLKLLDSESELVNLKIIGASVEGREIPMIHFIGKSQKQKIKVLLFCQQHGNEPSGKEAALILIKNIISNAGHNNYDNLELYIIPSLNPDGNEAGKRFNANKEDLNRNHLVISEPEVAALHNVFNEILPDVTLDVHEYSAFRKSFTEVGYVRSTEEQFGAPTNLNVSPHIIKEGLDNLFPFIEKELSTKDISFSNYYKLNFPDDTVRTSTTGIIDGRQSFAILNTFSFILEGRNGPSLNADLKRRTFNQLNAINSFLEFVDSNSIAITTLVKNGRESLVNSSDSIILQMDYKFEGENICLPMKLVPSLKDTIVPMKYSPNIEKLKTISRPIGYIISGDNENVITLLNKHNIKYELVTAPRNFLIEKYKIEKIDNKWLENKSFKIASVSKSSNEYNCKVGDVIVYLNQIHANMISIAFEPESMWGIAQGQEYGNLLEVGEDFPIYRIVNK